jgi:hypothetical protein
MSPEAAARAVTVAREVGPAAWVVADDAGIVAHPSEAEARRAFNRAKMAAEPRPVYLYRVVQVGATFASREDR